MAGTPAGGRRAAATNKARHGEAFYRAIGAKGGKISRGGIFGKDREFAAEMGRKGGQVSKRKAV
jgi:general stress protein YciG